MKKEELSQSEDKLKSSSILYKIGLICIFLSIIAWVVAGIIAVFPITLTLKIGIASGSIVFSEILFWIGVIFCGKEMANRIRGYFNPKKWFKNEAANSKNNLSEKQVNLQKAKIDENSSLE